MKVANLFVGALLACSAMTAYAAELSLFGKELRTVDRATLSAAAKSAGAKPAGSDTTTDRFNAAAVGLPGAKQLEVVYLNGRVVMAQYTFTPDGDTEERFRKMLVAKYGFPQSVDDTFLGTPPAEFDRQYIGVSKYRWKFANGMELVFSKEFAADGHLTYVNKPAEAEMRRLLTSAAGKRAADAADAKRDAF